MTGTRMKAHGVVATFVLFFFFLVSFTSGCNGQSAASLAPSASNLPSVSSLPTPANVVATDDDQSAGSTEKTYTTEVLLFTGAGVSTSDWQTTEEILKTEGITYELADSAQLNAMSLEELARFGVIVIPGGSGGTITSNLTEDTRLRVRKAVRDLGVGFVGFCAGAWVAVGPEADTESVASYGLAVAEGEVLPEYYPDGNTSLTAAMVPVTFADSSSRQLVWWGGPSTPEWAGGVVARYETGEPAISQTLSGKGYVVIAGPHPEAPEGWRATAGTDSDGLDYDIAVQMISAAINKQPMAAY